MQPTKSPLSSVVRPTDEVLQVKVLSPKKMIFLGQALSLSSVNSTGKFDILPQHANFITLVKNNQLTIVTKKGDTESYHFNLAIVLAVNNTVSVYTDIDKESAKLPSSLNK